MAPLRHAALSRRFEARGDIGRSKHLLAKLADGGLA
jgi:hypothetical protein